MTKNDRLLTLTCDLNRALSNVLGELEPDDRHALVEAASDRVPLWNFARSRDAFSRLRAAGLLKLDRFALTRAGASVAAALACNAEVEEGRAPHWRRLRLWAKPCNFAVGGRR